MTTADISDAEMAREILDAITKGDEEAAFELSQFCMSRVVKKDAQAMLYAIEGLARASAARGSELASAFLTDDWTKLKGILLKRLQRELQS